jgi:predicted nucleic acid-binding Zn ribbon protein
MPLFEFECPECGARVEKIFARAEQADTAELWCDHRGEPPEFAEVKMHRVPSAGSFVLKGAGFHCVDYKGRK